LELIKLKETQVGLSAHSKFLMFAHLCNKKGYCKRKTWF
jgi:hypothetical protein